MRNSLIIVSLVLLATCCGSPGEKGESQQRSMAISDSTKDASCVYLSVDEKNQPVISWCETDKKEKTNGFYLAYFDQRSGGFSSPIPVPIEQNVNFHEEGMPKVAIKSDGTVIAVYEISVPTENNPFAGFVHYIVSADKGLSWSKPVSLHDDTTHGKSYSFAAITRLSDGEIGACWLDAKSSDKANGRPVKFAKTNQHNAFEDEIVIDSIACECCRTAISSDANGKITIAFRDIINDSIRDMSISASVDNGKTFSAAMPFSKDGWIINGCPHNGPSLASDANSTYATWFTGGPEKGAYYCELNSELELVTRQLVSDRGRFIQLCLLADGSRLLAFDEKRTEGNKSFNKIVLNRITKNNIYASEIEMSGSLANHPVVREFGEKKAIVAWSQDNKVYCSVIQPESINQPIKRVPSNVNTSIYQNKSVTLFNKKDPVCGMLIFLMSEDTTLFQGHVYGFCSEHCKNKFVQAPATYTKKNKHL